MQESPRGLETRRRRIRVIFSAAVLWLATAVVASAQLGLQSASIAGQVRDGSGGVLPGVTVTATSPALQLPQVVTVTAEDGGYRLTPLPIGSYTVVYELPGFQSVRREGIELTAGFVARLDIVLGVGAVLETVTVTGESPVVDTTSTTVTTHLTRQALDSIPTSRDGYLSLFVHVPGAIGTLEVGGSNVGQTKSVRAFGHDSQSWQDIEGVLVTNSRHSSGASNYWDYQTFEETTVQTVGNEASVARRGMTFAAIVKSGGNQFHGELGWNRAPSRLQSDNLDDSLRALGIGSADRVHRRVDANGQLGGRIIRDKLWFFGSYRHRANEYKAVNAFLPDGVTPFNNASGERYLTGKLSYQATPTNRLVGFYTRSHRPVDYFVSEFRPYESREVSSQVINVAKTEWQNVWSSSLVTSLQFGRLWWVSNATQTSTKPATFDQATLKLSGDSVDTGERLAAWRNHVRGNVDWHQSNQHTVKVGFDYFADDWARGNDARESGDYRLIFDNGNPFQLVTWNHPITPSNIQHYLGIYATDSWTLGRRLTLNLGARYARDSVHAPEQCREEGQFAPARCFPEIRLKVFHTVVPRVHLSYDLRGDGKTAIRGGWGRFANTRFSDPELFSVNPNVRSETTWKWTDRNGNKLYEPGEVNFNPSEQVSVTGGSVSGLVNPDQRPAKSDEFMLGVDHQLVPNVGFRVTGVYSRVFDEYVTNRVNRPPDVYNIPITRPDPGPDALPGTADDPGTFFTYYDYPISLRGAAFDQTMHVNSPEATHSYKSLELALTKRPSSRWGINGSYVITKRNVPLGYTGSGNPPFNDPNALFNRADFTSEWIAKLAGIYFLPYGIAASGDVQHRSGNPFAREVLFRGGVTVPSQVLRVETLDARRLPHVNLVTIRFQKRIALAQSQALTVQTSVYNLLNVNTTTAVTVRSGPTFLRPTSIVLPRIVEFGLAYTF